MGMSTHAIGFKPPDEKWKSMKAVWDACKEAGVEPPSEVENYFGGDEPDEAGVVVDMSALKASGAVVRYVDDCRDGYDIHVDNLPPDVKIVRVYNSY